MGSPDRPACGTPLFNSVPGAHSVCHCFPLVMVGLAVTGGPSDVKTKLFSQNGCSSQESARLPFALSP